MANSPQTLLEFTDNLLSDIERGAITPQEAISASQQYAYLRESLSSQSGRLSEAALQGDEELVGALKHIFSETRMKLRDLPSFQASEPDSLLKEKEIKDTAFLRTTALSRSREYARTKLAPYTDKRRAFIHDLVSKYSAFTPTVSEKQVSSVVDQSLMQAAKEGTPAQTKERFAEMMAASSEELSGDSLLPDQRVRLKTIIRESIAGHDEYFSAAAAATKTERDIAESIYEHLDLGRPDVLADIVLNAPENQRSEALVRGVKLAQVAESLEQPRAAGHSTNGFLSPGNAKGVTKGLQQAADGILSLVGEPLREMVYKEKVNGTLRTLLTNTQQLTDRLGETFVHSALFTQISQGLSKSLSEKPQTAGAGSVFGDVFSTVFRGPLDPSLFDASKDRLLDYFELARASANAPKGYGFLPANMSPWEIFARRRIDQYNKGGAPFRIPWLPFPSLGFFGDRLGDALSGAVDGATSFIFTSPRISNELQRSRRSSLAPTSIFEDLPLFIAIVVVATITILFIFPSSFNMPQMGYASKVGTLLTSLYDKAVNEFNVINENIAATTFSCEWNGPPPPPATISVCPVHAPITQRPFDPNGSHRNLNAYDFGADQKTPVLAAQDGYVVSYDNFYGPNQYKYASYGNNVVLIGTNPTSGKTFCTNYAHLLDVSSEVVAAKGQPIVIKAGDVIGWVDTTGYTYGCIKNNCGLGYGTHLHFGYQGENQNVPMSLPPGCP